MTRVTKPKNLITRLRELPIGGVLMIPNKEYKTSSVRALVVQMKRDEGLSFEVSEKGLINECKVTRLR